jgi:hypothetical protein
MGSICHHGLFDTKANKLYLKVVMWRKKTLVVFFLGWLKPLDIQCWLFFLKKWFAWDECVETHWVILVACNYEEFKFSNYLWIGLVMEFSRQKASNWLDMKDANEWKRTNVYIFGVWKRREMVVKSWRDFFFCMYVNVQQQKICWGDGFLING